MKYNYIIRIDDGFTEWQEKIQATDLFTMNQMFRWIKFILNLVSTVKEINEKIYRIWLKFPFSSNINWIVYCWRTRNQ